MLREPTKDEQLEPSFLALHELKLVLKLHLQADMLL